MTKTELNAFSKVLTNRRAELGSGSASRDALTIETSADELDRIQNAGNRDWAMSNLERSSNQLREIDTAFQRIAAGTFGTCVDCEEIIGVRRLAAVPWASRCIVCQERADRAQKAGDVEAIEMAA